MDTNEGDAETTSDSGESAKPESPIEASSKSSAGRPNATMGMLCHLFSFVAFLGIPLGNLLGPLVIWLVKKEEDPFVDVCGKESLNFQISITIYGLAIVLIGFVIMIPVALIPPLGVLLVPLVAFLALAFMVTAIVLVIVASVRASEGGVYKYPYTIRFIR